MQFAIVTFLCAAITAASPDLEKARDRQDRAELERIAQTYASAAQSKPGDPDALYRLAVAQSYLAEVAIEVHDKLQANRAAETGIHAAEKAVELKKNDAEYVRILGTLCGQAISGNGMAALKWGKCALTSVNQAVTLDPKSSANYLSRGVGNYYLPPAFGGGIDLAIRDFQKAVDLDHKSADAYLWLGVALRKANRLPEAHKALAKAVELNPDRLWAKQQLDKTPAQ